MTTALRNLLAHSIDYAGLFPPAKLPLATAASNYADYQMLPDAWLLGKFICPAAQLAQLPLSASVWSLSALGRGGDTMSDWLSGLGQDMALIAAARLSVSSFEVRLPTEAFTTPDGLARCLDAFERPGDGVFLEVPSGPGFSDRVNATLAALQTWPGAGFKLRCGGLDASAFPEPRLIAEVLRAAFAVGVPLKATAGLHHPLRRWEDALQTWMHGFINLFFAGLLAQVGQAPLEDRIAVLLDRDPDAFSFAEHSASWRGYTWTEKAIKTLRRDQVLSFGSCSFDEPRDDLRELGWLSASGGD